MLKRLVVKECPHFSNLTLDFEKGFNILTGVSGSGKSVILNLILSLFGVVNPSANLVEGVFVTNLKLPLKEFGILEDDFLVISILKKQSIRYFINNQLVSKKNLIFIMSNLYKYIGAKKSIELNSAYLLELLDSIILKHSKQILTLKKNLKSYALEKKKLSLELIDITAKKANIENLKEFAIFEINKIKSINPKEGELDELLESKKKLSKKDKAIKIANDALASLDNLESVYKAIEFFNIESSFKDSSLEVNSLISSSLEEFSKIDIDIEGLLNRLEGLSSLNKTYGSIKSALEKLELQEKNLLSYENLEFDELSLSKKIKELDLKISLSSNDIHELRLKHLLELENLINSFTKDLKLEDLRLKLDLKNSLEVENNYLELFMNDTLSSNLSSGEYNRARMCVLCARALVSKNDTSILLLDEIDANLSGEESEGVANLLKLLSDSYQIFAISHQSHMPFLCDNHYLVRKTDTFSNVSLLKYEERIEEIARMISGKSLSKEALQFARARLPKS